jgi:hypothetical protein
VRDDRIYLDHVLQAINRILEYTADGEHVFFLSVCPEITVTRWDERRFVGAQHAAPALAHRLYRIAPLIMGRTLSALFPKCGAVFAGKAKTLLDEPAVPPWRCPCMKGGA